MTPEQRRRADMVMIMQVLRYLFWKAEGAKAMPKLHAAIEARVRELEAEQKRDQSQTPGQ